MVSLGKMSIAFLAVSVMVYYGRDPQRTIDGVPAYII
jgi:hypothetical protein